MSIDKVMILILKFFLHVCKLGKLSPIVFEIEASPEMIKNAWRDGNAVKYSTSSKSFSKTYAWFINFLISVLSSVRMYKSTSWKLNLTHNSPEYLEWNLALEKFEGFFPLNYAILSFGKCLNYWILGFQRGDIFYIVTILNWKIL